MGGIPAIGAVVTTTLARGAYSSTGARVLLEVALGSGTLPAEWLADVSDFVDEEVIRSVSRTLRRLSLASIGLVGLDLLVRY